MRKTVLIILSLTLLLAGKGHAAPSSSLEYRVKAAYLLQFTRYTEWPSQAFPSATAPIRICILGPDPFGDTLEKTVTGRKSGTRGIEVHRLTEFKGSSCHVIFIGQTQEGTEAEVLKSAEGKPILTIGESNGFLSRGGILKFIILEDTVQFEVNLKIARHSLLKLSSRMLALAKRVVGEESAGRE